MPSSMHRPIPRRNDDIPYLFTDREAYGRVTGECGDTLVLRLEIASGRVESGHYGASKCDTLKACAEAMLGLVRGKPIDDAERIGARAVIAAAGSVPADHEHCASLAASTLRATLRNFRVHRESGGGGSE